MFRRNHAISILLAGMIFISCSAAVRAEELRLPMDQAKMRLVFEGDGAFTHLGDDGGNSGFKSTLGGGRLAVVRKLTPTWGISGGFGGYGGTLRGNDTNSAQRNFTAYQFTMKSESKWRQLVFHTDFGYTPQNGKEKTAADSLNYSADQFDFGASVRMPTELGFSTLEPILGFRQMILHESFTQNFSRDHSPLTLCLGGRYTYRYATPLALILPGLEAYWQHDFSPGNAVILSSINHILPAITYRNTQPPNDRIQLGAGIATRMGRSLDLALRYSVHIGSNWGNHGIIAAMNWNF